MGQLILEVDGQKVEGKDFVERRFYTMEGIKAVGESGASVRPSVWQEQHHNNALNKNRCDSSNVCVRFVYIGEL